MESNDLFDELSESGGHFSEEAVQNIAAQLQMQLLYVINRTLDIAYRLRI